MMDGQIKSMQRNIDVRVAARVRLTLTAEDTDQANMLRSLFDTWFYGWTKEDDAVLEDRFAAVFERQGWVKLETVT